MKRATILFAIFIIAIVILADSGHLGLLGAVYRFPYGDKVGHFVLFGILNFLVTVTRLYSLPPERVDASDEAISTGSILGILVALEEFSQRWFHSRSANVFDLLASLAGMLIGGWLAVKIKRAKDSERG